MRLKLLVGLAVVMTLYPAEFVYAQQDKEILAREHFQRGESAYKRGDYDSAIKEWQTAYEAAQKPRIMYNLALVYERLGRLADAISSLKLYVDSSDSDDAAHSDAVARLASLQQRIALTGIRVVGGIEGSTIFVDDRDWGRTPRPDKIFVKPGTHKVVVKHQGYRDFVSSVVVPAGQVAEVGVDMGEEGDSPVVTPPIASTIPAVSDTQTKAAAFVEPDESGTGRADRDSGDSSLYWFIAGGALAAGALTAGIWWADRGSALGECDEGGFYCENESSISGQRDMAAAFTIVLSAGAIGAFVVGILQLSGDAESESPTALSCLNAKSGDPSCKRMRSSQGIPIRF